MTFPSLEDLEGEWLDRPVMDALGDSIQFQLAGGSFVPMKAFGEFAEAIRDMSTGRVIDQDITLQILIEDLPRRPISSDRVRIARVPGATFKPTNVRRDQSGVHWEFELEKVGA